MSLQHFIIILIINGTYFSTFVKRVRHAGREQSHVQSQLQQASPSPAACPLVFDIASESDNLLPQQAEQQHHTRHWASEHPPGLHLSVSHESSPHACPLVMDLDCTPVGDMAVQYAQQDSWRCPSQSHASHGPVRDRSPQTCPLVMDADSDPREHGSGLLHAQQDSPHRHDSWQQPSAHDMSQDPVSYLPESSHCSMLINNGSDSYSILHSSPHQQQQQQQQQQLDHHRQQGVQDHAAHYHAPINFDTLDSQSGVCAPAPGFLSVDAEQHQVQHETLQHCSVQDEGKQPSGWQGGVEQRSGSEFFAATSAAAPTAAVQWRHVQTAPTSHQAEDSSAMPGSIGQSKSHTGKVSAEMGLQHSTCPLVFDCDEEAEQDSHSVAAEHMAQEEGEQQPQGQLWSAQQPLQRLRQHANSDDVGSNVDTTPLGHQSNNLQEHAQAQTAQDTCPLLFDIMSDEDEGQLPSYHGGSGTDSKHHSMSIDHLMHASTSGHSGYSPSNAGSAQHLGLSPHFPAPAGQYRHSPAHAHLSQPSPTRSKASQHQEGFGGSSERMQPNAYHLGSEAHCPIIFDDLTTPFVSRADSQQQYGYPLADLPGNTGWHRNSCTADECAACMAKRTV